jgi:hypothetical protein
MVLLVGVGLGLLLAVGLGGRPSRLLQLSFRDGWAVALALGVQVVLFSRLGAALDDGTARPLHLVTYALLAFFLWRNRSTRALIPLGIGMLLNAAAITANGGRMPLSRAAATAVGLEPTANANVSFSAHRLAFLGDVFALPRRLPLSTVVSPGDVLIVIGVITLITIVSLGERGQAPFDVRRLRDPFGDTTFRKLASARFISYLGDWLTIAAVIGWIYRDTGSTGTVAAFMLVRMAPPILGGSLATLLVDRLPRRSLLVGLELARAACVACAFVSVLYGARIGVLIALGCSGALTAIANAGTAALVPTLLPPGQLPSGNALLALLKDVAMALGAAGAGAALAAGVTAPALAIDGATFIVAAFLLRGLSVPPARRSSGRALDGLRYLRGHRIVLLLVASFSTATVATGLVNATLPSLLSGRGLGAGGYGFGMAALAGGAAVGEAIVGLTAPAPTADRWIGGGLLALAGLFGLLALADYGPTAILLLAAIGLVDGTTDVVYSTVLQRDSDAGRLGAVFGFSTSMMTTTMVAAFAVAPLAGRLLGSGGVVMFAAGVLAVGGCVGLAAVQVGARTVGRAASLPAAS